jgi:hypothetical protein
MTGPRAQVREAEFVEQARDRALVIDHAEAILDHRLQIDPAPAHHAVRLAIGTGLHELGQFGLLRGRQLRGRAVRLAVEQASGAFVIEAVNPVAQGAITECCVRRWIEGGVSW